MKAESMQTKDNLCIRNQENGLEHLRKNKKSSVLFQLLLFRTFDENNSHCH